MKDTLPALQKINHHLGIALAELNDNPGIHFALQEQRKLIKVKLKLEEIIHRMNVAEDRAKKIIFNRLKS
jgi:hypothetical protein